MRTLGARALSALVIAGSGADLEDAIAQEVSHIACNHRLTSQIRMLSAVDTGSIHGGLLALNELASVLAPNDARKTQVSLVTRARLNLSDLPGFDHSTTVGPRHRISGRYRRSCMSCHLTNDSKQYRRLTPNDGPDRSYRSNQHETA